MAPRVKSKAAGVAAKRRTTRAGKKMVGKKAASRPPSRPGKP